MCGKKTIFGISFQQWVCFFQQFPLTKGIFFQQFSLAKGNMPFQKFAKKPSKVSLMKKIHKKGPPKYFTKGMVFHNFSLTEGILFSNVPLTKGPIMNIVAAHKCTYHFWTGVDIWKHLQVDTFVILNILIIFMNNGDFYESKDMFCYIVTCWSVWYILLLLVLTQKGYEDLKNVLPEEVRKNLKRTSRPEVLNSGLY